MSSVEQATEPKKKRNPLVIAFMLICGLAGMLGGGLKMYKGYQEITGSGDSAHIQLLTESDLAIDEANKFNLGAAPLFASLMSDVDNLGLKAFQEQRREPAQQVSEQFGKAAAEFRSAAKKLQEAAELQTREKFKAYVASKTQGYDLAAEICEQNQEIIRLVLDNSFDKLDDVLPKMQEVAARRDAAQKSMNEVAAEADRIGKELTDTAKS